MTGWKMWEHGVPDSRLTVIQQIEDYIDKDGRHRAQWKCECNCSNHTIFPAQGYLLTMGRVKSCGCLQKERTTEVHHKQNKYDLSGEYGVLWLSNTAEEVYFSLCDADLILKYNWYKNARGYATAYISGKLVRMHQLLGCDWHDHHNRNKLDNRRENLIQCTVQENIRNKPKQSNNTSGFIGVSWDSNKCKWFSQIGINKHNYHLGYFNNKNDAICARLNAELKYFGEFAPQRHLFEEYGIDTIQNDNKGE